MPGIQTANGKAFEYACLLALYNALQTSEDVTIEDSPQMRTARNLYNNMPGDRYTAEDFIIVAHTIDDIIKNMQKEIKN